MTRWARAWHGLALVVAVAALVLQTVLVIEGAAVLDEADAPSPGTALLRLVSYFTIQSNLAVALSVAVLVRDPATSRWRALRLAALAGILVTGLVHWFLLRPLLDLEGASAVADTLLHVVVPVLVAAGWLVFGPRPRITPGTIALAMIWPVLWLGYTLLMGELNGWYPYPFLDVAQLGYPSALLSCAGVTLVFLALFALLLLLDRVLPAAPERRART